MPGYFTSYTSHNAAGSAPSNAAYLTVGSVAGLSNEVDITNLTSDANFANSTGSLVYLDVDLEVVINDSSQDINFRVESNDNANIITVDAGANTIGLGSDVNANSRLFVAFPTLVPAVNANGTYVSIIPALSEAASGTHAIMAGLGITALDLTTTGGAGTTRATTVYISGAPSGAATQNMALWVDDGLVRFDGTVETSLGSNGAAAYSFHSAGTSDSDTGIYSTAADQVAITCGGAQRVLWTTSTTEFNATSVDADFIVDGNSYADLFHIDAGLNSVGIGRTALTATLLTLDKNFTASAERNLLLFNSITHTITDNINTCRLNIFTGATYTAGSSLAVTHAPTLDISAPTTSGGNAVVKNPSAIRITGSSGTRYLSQDDFVYSGLRVAAHTVTMENTVTINVDACPLSAIRIDQLTVVEELADESVTFATAAGLYIVAGPVASGSNMAITASYAIFVDSGTSRFDGEINITTGGINHDAGNIGFFGATPAGQQASAANLTNSVTSGGTDNTVDNVIAADVDTTAAALVSTRNAIYQLARKLKQVNDGLRVYGILT